MSEQGKIKILANNRKANFEYETISKVEAGIVLLGTEVKSIRDSKINLQDAFARITGGEIWLTNAHISEYKHGNINNHEPTRPRKLLLNKKEIRKLKAQVEQKGLTLIPLKIYLKDSKIKVELALARGKKIYDKRETIKKRETDRNLQRLR
ncbi:MAG: SsrA-binding protein SmpB [Ignavibacteriaceae bacterium]|jgi:SsrA-binding protein|nr:MAG: SsrA-binding protein SmpB [Chlorobiota bacterium]KXK05912.1 MAG: tmRNA-binding protein [Chlorobi bacterium OLB4]MBV6398261.1 SsrA-binding protein [Ignavibacteria bacterium]MCC6886146.1 SsrA-binding protein SmpB [Ignavibacteriales bacterium]MCE7952602.1 SsrA-binding protein SmpB [Chlorobi bacterium CHB7]MDL1886714.1 SsrA-binding protein SmpB [Ignavibacteria bacterium CHB1]MEB2329618.1 SsrA-binding protein SmpB [Ignavibacteriaceae bacterium]OQY77743.1 MAG: SsrA-binding protein [Ignavib